MSELVACIGISVAVLCVSIVGCSLMLCDKISGLIHEIWELRMDLEQGIEIDGKEQNNEID